MTIRISELEAWLRRIKARGAKHVWVDEGGLCLQADNDAYCEVGGGPDEEDADEDVDVDKDGAAFDADEEGRYDENEADVDG